MVVEPRPPPSSGVPRGHSADKPSAKPMNRELLVLQARPCEPKSLASPVDRPPEPGPDRPLSFESNQGASHARQGPPHQVHSRVQPVRSTGLAQPVRLRQPPAIPRSSPARERTPGRRQPLDAAWRRPVHDRTHRGLRSHAPRAEPRKNPKPARRRPSRPTSRGAYHEWTGEVRTSAISLRADRDRT